MPAATLTTVPIKLIFNSFNDNYNTTIIMPLL